MLLQGEVFIQEALVAIQAQAPVQVQVQVKVLNLGTSVILQKVLVQNHLIAVQVAQVLKTITQAIVVKQQKEVIFQYLSQYRLVTTAMEEVIMVSA
jgi:hypothetical protein